MWKCHIPEMVILEARRLVVIHSITDSFLVLKIL